MGSFIVCSGLWVTLSRVGDGAVSGRHHVHCGVVVHPLTCKSMTLEHLKNIWDWAENIVPRLQRTRAPSLVCISTQSSWPPSEPSWYTTSPSWSRVFTCTVPRVGQQLKVLRKLTKIYNIWGKCLNMVSPIGILHSRCLLQILWKHHVTLCMEKLKQSISSCSPMKS